MQTRFTYPISGFLQPLRRFCLILRYALTLQQHNAVVMHRLQVALLRPLAVELGGGAQVALHAL